MFTRIFKPKSITTHWLGPIEPHLLNLTLENVTNPFDADALWDDQYSGRKGITNSCGDPQHRWKRLKKALDDHRITLAECDTYGRMLGKTFVFTDVVVWISKSLWLEDMARGAANVKMLAHNFARIHMRDFEASIYRGRIPNYVVMPGEDLSRAQVRFQFGRGVFVPKENDRLVAKLQFELELHQLDLSERQRIQPWIFFLKDAKRDERKIGLYEGQESLLMSMDCLVQPRGRTPYLFSENNSYLLINQIEANVWECFYAQDDLLQPLKKTLMEDGSSSFLLPKSQIIIKGQSVHNTLHIRLRSLNAAVATQPQAPAYTAPISPAIVEEPPKVATHHPEIPPQQPESLPTAPIAVTPAEAEAPAAPQPDQKRDSIAKFGMTLIPDKTPEPSYSYALVVEGIALPRIDAKFEIDGLRNWFLWLDDQGNPINNPDIDPEQNHSMVLHATSRKNQLFYRASRKHEFAPVKQLPMTLPFKHSGIELAKSPFDDWLAFLQFANPFAYYTEENRRYLIGRHNPEKKGVSADIQLDQISHPKCLQWAEGEYAHKSGSLAQLGLSRQHAWVEIRDQQMLVRLAHGFRIHYYNKGLNFGKCLQSGTDEALILANGDRILVGNYILRFDRLDQVKKVN